MHFGAFQYVGWPFIPEHRHLDELVQRHVLVLETSTNSLMVKTQIPSNLYVAEPSRSPDTLQLIYRHISQIVQIFGHTCTVQIFVHDDKSDSLCVVLFGHLG